MALLQHRLHNFFFRGKQTKWVMRFVNFLKFPGLRPTHIWLRLFFLITQNLMMPSEQRADKLNFPPDLYDTV